jgi:hypothetical protein
VADARDQQVAPKAGLAELEAEVVEIAFQRRMGPEFVVGRPPESGSGRVEGHRLGESGVVMTRGVTQSRPRAAHAIVMEAAGEPFGPRHWRAMAFLASRYRA